MKFLNFVYIFLLLIFLIGCDNFKRFEQKKYFCKTNKLEIQLIDILETRSIKKAYITISGKEYQMEISSISETDINLIYNNFDININFNENQISVTTDNEVVFLSCEESNFNI